MHALRAGVVCLSLLAVWAAPLARRAHEAGTRHQTCAEHGESVHVGGHDLGPSTRTASKGAALFESEASVHEHEHCVISGIGSPKMVVSPPERGLSGAAMAALARTERHAMLAPSKPVWATAPKQSPPRRG